MGCARVGMDAGDWHSRGDRPWKGHSPAARAAIPALKGQDHSAQGNALVVLHISVLIDWCDQPLTGGASSDPSGRLGECVDDHGFRSPVANSTRGYNPPPHSGRRPNRQPCGTGLPLCRRPPGEEAWYRCLRPRRGQGM